MMVVFAVFCLDEFMPDPPRPYDSVDGLQISNGASTSSYIRKRVTVKVGRREGRSPSRAVYLANTKRDGWWSSHREKGRFYRQPDCRDGWSGRFERHRRNPDPCQGFGVGRGARSSA